MTIVIKEDETTFSVVMGDSACDCVREWARQSCFDEKEVEEAVSHMEEKVDYFIVGDIITC